MASTRTSEQPEGHDLVASKGPCPKCGADDNLVTYMDGHAYCFTPGCGYRVSARKDTQAVSQAPQPFIRDDTGLIEHGDMQPWAGRGLTEATAKRYQYYLSHYGKEAAEVHVWPLTDQSGKLAHQRLRFTADKDFMVVKGASLLSANECQLFGQSTFGDQFDKRVVITEGEIDAMSVAQAASFKYPVVSINGGAGSAVRCLKANYKWLDRFSEIILWFDDDEAGHTATEEAVKLFAVGKVKIARIIGFKDANAALTAKKHAEIEQAVYGAQLWSPKGIVNAADRLKDLIDVPETLFWEYPYPGLQEMTRGCRRGEVSYHVAGTGIGKTTSIIETLVHFLDTTAPHTEVPAKIGYLGFEELIRGVQLAFLSVKARRRLNLDPLPPDELTKLHHELFGDRRVELFDAENAEWTFDAVISYIRFMVRALDVNIAVLDPLTFLVAMLPGETDERRALDKVSQALAALAKELNCHIAVCHHLTRPKEGPGHEEGGRVSLAQVRGSGGVANFASLVVGYERNQQAEAEEAKTVTIMRLLKNRFVGVTGIACYTQYDMATGRTYQMPQAEALQLLGGAGGKQPKSAFSDDDEDITTEF